MKITRMAAALAVSCAAVTCSALAAVPAQADASTSDAMVAAAPAEQSDMAAPADAAAPDAVEADGNFAAALAPGFYGSSFTRSVQSAADNTNFDEYAGDALWTRSPDLGYQNFTFTLIGRTPNGNGVYTIKGSTFNRCIQDFGIGNTVRLRDCDTNNLAQRWVVDDASGYTTIESQKNPNAVLQGNGRDTEVTLTYYNGDPNQWWTLYNK